MIEIFAQGLPEENRRSKLREELTTGGVDNGRSGQREEWPTGGVDNGRSGQWEEWTKGGVDIRSCGQRLYGQQELVICCRFSFKEKVILL